MASQGWRLKCHKLSLELEIPRPPFDCAGPRAGAKSKFRRGGGLLQHLQMGTSKGSRMLLNQCFSYDLGSFRASSLGTPAPASGPDLERNRKFKGGGVYSNTQNGDVKMLQNAVKPMLFYDLGSFWDSILGGPAPASGPDLARNRNFKGGVY